MTFYPPYNKNPFTLIFCVQDEDVRMQIESLGNGCFSISEVFDIDQAYEMVKGKDDAIIIVDHHFYTRIDECVEDADVSLMVITDSSLDLKNRFLSLVPKELFISKYSEEIIFWCMEKTRLKREIIRKNTKKEKLEGIIKDIQDISIKKSFDGERS